MKKSMETLLVILVGIVLALDELTAARTAFPAVVNKAFYRAQFLHLIFTHIITLQN